MTIVIHHNPDCGTSRNVLSIIRASGVEPLAIEYLQTGWTQPLLLGLFSAADHTPCYALRITKSPAEALGLLDETVSEEAVLDAMIENPVLANRTILCSPKGVRLCRPLESVLDLLETMAPGPLYKEDGQMILNENGDRFD